MKLTIVGRNPQEANLVLNSQFVSGYHAEIIQLDNGDIYLVDKSSNGTFVDGARIPQGKEVLVRRGQNVSFADVPLNWNQIEDIKIPSNVKQILGIGSHYANQIKISGNAVSRFHATIRQTSDGKWYICDHSKNGTSVNGKKIPSDSYVEIKAGDEIECAGFHIDNPIKKKAKTGLIVGIVAAVIAVGAGLAVLIGSLRTYSDQEIFTKYQSSLALMVFSYHFEASCGTLDLSDLPDPDSWSKKAQEFTEPLSTSFIIKRVDGEDFLVDFDGTNSMIGFGSGFFVGNEGTIITNRHVARPWESTTASMSDVAIQVAAEDYFRGKLQRLYEMGYTSALQYISQVKVEGKLDNMRAYPNNQFIDDNHINCMELACSSEEEDLAIFKTRTAIPSNVTPIPISKIKPVEPTIGSHVLVIGFPFGLNLQDKNTPLQALTNAGNISQNNNKVWFGFDAASYHGASGSPIFNDKGYVIGVLNAGVTKTQGFNRAIRSEYLYNLINNEGIK